MRVAVSLCLALILGSAHAQHGTNAQRFAPPPGFSRPNETEGSFGAFLRALPLKPMDAPVLLHNGSPKHRQDAHAAVIDVSTGTKDLQQCADAVMRLRAEYLFALGQHERIAFRFTNGFRAEWQRWRMGERIRVKGNTCRWVPGARPDSSHDALLRFLEQVFLYAGTLSLSRELLPATGDLAIGDVFIQGGSPGHAVIVVDAARHPDGRMVLLLAQGYMPAQDLHVLRNTAAPKWGAWFLLRTEGELHTPEWTFRWSDRRRWP
jgi:hypothetical protein